MDQRQFIKEMLQTRPYWGAEEFIARRILDAAGIKGNKGRQHLAIVQKQMGVKARAGSWDAAVDVLVAGLALKKRRKSAIVIGMDRSAIPKNGGVHTLLERSPYLKVEPQDGFMFSCSDVYLVRTGDTECYAAFVVPAEHLITLIPPFSVHAGPENTRIIVQPLRPFLDALELEKVTEEMLL